MNDIHRLLPLWHLGLVRIGLGRHGDVAMSSTGEGGSVKKGKTQTMGQDIFKLGGRNSDRILVST